MWGHHHSYQRTCPVAREKCSTDGITHIVVGSGGQELMDFSPETPEWIVVEDNKHFGYSRFTVNSTSLVFEFIRDDDGQVHDTFTINKRTRTF